MAGELVNDINTLLDRVLRERLESFNVPIEVRNNLAQEILAIMQRPERKPFGAAVCTPEASMAADVARQRGRALPTDARPRIM